MTLFFNKILLFNCFLNLGYHNTLQTLLIIFYLFIARLYRTQRSDPNALWRVPDEPPLSHAQPNELIVGGVYLRLFIAKPGWVLRRPKEFLAELMTVCLSLMERDKPNVSVLTVPIVCRVHQFFLLIILLLQFIQG